MSAFLLAKIFAYLLAARFTMRRLGGATREIVFAVLNLGIVYSCFFSPSGIRLGFLFYLAVVLFQYGMLWLFAMDKGMRAWIAFFVPLIALAVVRYCPVPEPLSEKLGHAASLAPLFVGISYLAFRSSQLVLEVRNGVVPVPSLAQYIGFCFFAPTLSVGPINPYSNFLRGFEKDFPPPPLGRCLGRILVGCVKYRFLGSLCYQLGYPNFLLDGNYHHWIDLPIAAVAYYLYLYCNFSGFCDMMIGAGGIIGIPVAENFSNPFAARNVKEFWNRWHITLSAYMRDVVFSPLSKLMVRAAGPSSANHGIAAAIFVVFLLIGIWHGAGWNFAIFGAIHAIGTVTNHYYTIALKGKLGRDGFKAYNANRWIHALAVAATFCYVSASLFFFANSLKDAKAILTALHLLS